MGSFVHLNVHSCFSMLDGASSLEDLTVAAGKLEMPVLALTDTDGLYAAVPFVRACEAQGIRPILGVDLTDPDFPGTGPAQRRAVLLARNGEGYRALCRIISRRHIAGDFNWLQEVSELPASVVVLAQDETVIRRRRDRKGVRDAVYVEVLGWDSPDGREHRDRMLDMALALKVPAVATNAVRFVSRKSHDVHRLLSALRLNLTVGTLPADRFYPADACLCEGKDLAARFWNHREVLENSDRIASECHVTLDLNSRKLPAFPVPGGGEPYLYLRGLALQGLSERYDTENPAEARAVLERELGVIRKMELSNYFLICWDIIHFAHSRGIPCLGRGSAANSIVSYCLQITHVDPLAHNLFFERFLNDQRSSLPDFDLDFGTDDREQVLDYIFDFHGRDRVAMIGTHVTFQARAAFREISVAMGLPKGEVDGFIKRLPHFSGTDNLQEKLHSSPETRDLPLDREPFATLWRYAVQINGFPRHMATHPCGLVITPNPIQNYMPLQLGDKGLAITQWSMYPVEDAGLLKIDILGQKGLEVISHTIKAVQAQGLPLPASPKTALTDPRTREWMRNGHSIGCFYIESPAMINLIRQARCDDFECLTALSSIIRPGVSNYGGKHAYLRRHLKLEHPHILHPLLQPILKDTQGCLIYQEQVIRIASELADLSLGEADDLRRMMSFKKNRKKLEDYRTLFYDGCRRKRIPEKTIDEIYRQVESFAGYAFCKAHSASFALESFESLFYKSHFPAEFMAAVLSGGGGYYGSLEYLEEARRLGIVIHPPCINGSEFPFTGRDMHLRVGLMQVKNLREETAHKIVDHREKNGPYTGLMDFLLQVEPAVDEARNLAKCGAMRSLGRTIPELLWGIEIFTKGIGNQPRSAALQRIRQLWQKVPALPNPSLAQQMMWEMEILGLTPSAHPFRLFTREISNIRHLRPVIRSVDLAARTGRETYLLGWRVIGKKTRTKNAGELMTFMTFCDEWGRFEATFFPASFQRNAKEILRGPGPFLLKGSVETEFGVPMLIAEQIRLIATAKPEIRNTRGAARKKTTHRSEVRQDIFTSKPSGISKFR